jgi:hypothetical protein
MARRLGAGVLVVLVCFAAIALTCAPIAGAQTETGTVTLVHGVRGLVADIYLDGKVALQVFQPERTAGPLQLPAGAHAVEVRPTGAAPTTTPLLAATLNIPVNSRQSAVVHLSAAGQPALSVYPDDVSAIPAGQARVVLRHAAAAPPIDVQIDQQVVAAALITNAQSVQNVAAGTHAVAVASNGRNIVPSRDVMFTGGTANFMYLVGSMNDNNLTWLAQTVDGIGGAPLAVRSGEGGLAAPREFPYVTVVLLALGLVVLATIAARSTTSTATVGAPAGSPSRWLTARRWIAAGGVVASAAGLVDAAQWSGSRPTRANDADASPPDRVETSPHKLITVSSKPDRPVLGDIATLSARLDDRLVKRAPAPVSVAIDGFGIRAPIVAVGADPETTEMDLPADASVAAWYAPGPSPGQSGSAVIASHVDYGGQLGAFFGLARVDAGARIRVDYDDGSMRWFIVTARASYAKAELPVADLFRADGKANLALITCGGTYDAKTRSYRDNVVVYAQPEVSPTTPA